MIGCDDARNKIALYVDRELGGSEALEFEAHLTGCAPCRMAYEDSGAVVDGVRAASPLYVVPELWYAAIELLVATQDSRCAPASLAAIGGGCSPLVAGVILGIPDPAIGIVLAMAVEKTREFLPAIRIFRR